VFNSVSHLSGKRSRNRGALDGRERSHSVALGAIGTRLGWFATQPCIHSVAASGVEVKLAVRGRRAAGIAPEHRW